MLAGRWSIFRVLIVLGVLMVAIAGCTAATTPAEQPAAQPQEEAAAPEGGDLILRIASQVSISRLRISGTPTSPEPISCRG